ncbi:MAG: response regulator transcription factor [Chloroflexi bacterium]|nr:response regulator transcription factor [Chloroflexota bacterium]
MSRKILIVDDEPLIVDSVKYGLEKEGFTMVAAYDGEQALEKFRDEKPDLVLLDVLLPKRDGWEVCRTIRAESRVPIVMLTARTEETDRVLGLEMGADDYLAKPFGMRELIARVRAALRRATEYAEPITQAICIGDVTLDTTSHRVIVRGKPVEMTLKEYDLLTALMGRAGQVIKRNDLIDQVWQTDWVGDTRTLDVHIRWLREKIEKRPSLPRYIQTVRGVGYRFATAEEIGK